MADKIPSFLVAVIRFPPYCPRMDLKSTEQKIEIASQRLADRMSAMIGSQARVKVFQDALQTLPPGGHVAKKIEEKIEQERTEQLDIHRSFTEIKAEKSALEEIKRILTKPDKQFSLRITSELFRVEKLMKAKGVPLTLEEIMEGLGVMGEEKKKSLRGSLRQYAKDGKIFASTALPDVFGLLEFCKPTTNNGGNQSES
ncbi:MAG TPA: hypothetical protein VMR33_22995 [Candidatus Baltobacteraceae bacterium]|nr:hypothetical protein [Candidatus Baltobacteraceae bacterium]